MNPPLAAAARSEAARGLSALAIAFVTWGVFPLYMRMLRPATSLQITASRVLFCCFFVLGFLRARGAMNEVRVALADPRVRMRLVASAVLISVNWLVFVWAVNSDHIVDASLGYFMNPLVNVLLGVVVLRERLRSLQWLAITFAAAGVVYLTWLAGAPPWIALSLALSFSGYGLLRKTVAVDAMAGLGVESLLVAPIALVYLGLCELTGTGVLHLGDPMLVALLVMSGLWTALPLWLFAYGARRVKYSTVGVIQYIAPSMSLAIGVLIFHEPFPLARAAGFAMIWAGLVLYAFDGLRARA
jgi:chloramphenicol-sensitive protein RarD